MDYELALPIGGEHHLNRKTWEPMPEGECRGYTFDAVFDEPADIRVFRSNFRLR